jgi:hypothetical protein
MGPCRLPLLGAGQDGIDDHIFGEVSGELRVRIKPGFKGCDDVISRHGREKGSRKGASPRLSATRLFNWLDLLHFRPEGAGPEEDELAMAYDSRFAFPFLSMSIQPER